MVPEGQICQSERSMKEDVRRRGQSAGGDAFKCCRKLQLKVISSVTFCGLHNWPTLYCRAQQWDIIKKNQCLEEYKRQCITKCLLTYYVALYLHSMLLNTLQSAADIIMNCISYSTLAHITLIYLWQPPEGSIMLISYIDSDTIYESSYSFERWSISK